MLQNDLSRGLSILRSVYPVVLTIEEFSQKILYRDGRKAVFIEPSDSDFHKMSARRVIVCTDKMLQERVASRNQVAKFSEVLAYVLNSAKKKGKSNVLSYGYILRRPEHRQADALSFQGELKQSALFINSSDFWKTVNERLGTDVTRYLLEKCSVFVAAPPSCLFQVCGVPLYRYVTMEMSYRFLLSRPRSSVPAAMRRLRASSSVAIPKQGVIAPKQGRWSRTCNKRSRRPGKWKHVEGEELTEGPVSKRRKTKILINGQRGKGLCKIAPQLEGAPSWRTGAPPTSRPSQTFIHTREMMYGGRGLRSFLLNKKLRGGAEGMRCLQGQDLVRLVFFQGAIYFKSIASNPRRLPNRFHSMVDLFSQLLVLHSKCPYAQLLRKNCPVVGWGEDLSSLLPLHCPPFSVYLFIRECLHWVVPKELWGSAHNRLHFLSRVKAFLCMGRFDRLSLSELLWKMKVNDCYWLKISKKGGVPAGEHRYREHLLGRFLSWLLGGYVVGLVRAIFYVTQSTGQKNLLRFYRDDVWAKIQELGFRKQLAKGQWELLTCEEVTALPKTTVVSHLRWIPKMDGLRPIVRIMKKDAKARFYQSQLKDLYDVLRVCVQDRPSFLGSTVFGIQDIHRVLSSFAAVQKENPRRLYFVKADVSGAYDSLPHNKLLQVVCETLSPFLDEVFSVRRYAQVWADSCKGVRKAFHRQANTLADTQMSMKGFVMAQQREKKIHNAIMVEQHFSSDVRGTKVLDFFKQMLSNYIIRFGKTIFRQSCGVPQGSVVSTLLCCLCYGHMENTLLSHVVDGGGCLMRLVDDFLLITPELSKAQGFLRTLQAGVAEYGCFMNPRKVAANFPLGDDYPELHVIPSGSLFPWCGLLVDPSSLDVYADYSSYAGLSVRSSLTLVSTPHAGLQMKRKLLSILKLKCHALFLDLKISCLCPEFAFWSKGE
ncbi:telomerase reverse transcriptase isoform X2 [Megalops cyprinoides]|uniref:telomerase reverse transcriptase isoform X2 n=1 Tax=Megalops cyprinoides TaxID=118141 RepID=UPI0018641914|nr:telomerase reverse transcriptase isoform X2 [Megalops cyprinoides]